MEPLNKIVFSDRMGRRLDERLIKVWNDARRGSNELPLFRDFFQQYIADMWPFLFVLHLNPQGGPAVIDKIGEALTSGIDQNLNGKTVSDIPEKTILYHATRDYNVAPLKRGVASASGEFINNDGNIVLYRSTFLPVREEHDKVSAVVGAASYRVQIV